MSPDVVVQHANVHLLRALEREGILLEPGQQRFQHTFAWRQCKVLGDTVACAPLQQAEHARAREGIQPARNDRANSLPQLT